MKTIPIISHYKNRRETAMESETTKKRKKNTKEKSKKWVRPVSYLILGLAAVVGYLWITWNLSLRILQPIIFGVLLLVVFYLDNSGIRLSLVKKLPEDFPGKKFLSMRRRIGDRLSQYCKTFTMWSLLLYWILPETRVFFLATTIALPILAVYRYIRYNATISLSGATKNELSPTASTLLVPATMFVMWGMFNHAYSTLFWVLLAVISNLFYIPFLLFTQEYKKKISVAFGFLFLAVFFTFGSLEAINVDYDFSQPQEYEVTVVDKHLSSGRSKVCYITVSPWGDNTDETDIEVDKDSYRSAVEGDTATVVQFQGALKMPWHALVTKERPQS
jgi:hypothetical protein